MTRRRERRVVLGEGEGGFLPGGRELGDGAAWRGVGGERLDALPLDGPERLRRARDEERVETVERRLVADEAKHVVGIGGEEALAEFGKEAEVLAAVGGPGAAEAEEAEEVPDLDGVDPAWAWP